MRGFKSFGPRKVIVSLDRGLTVITGPNGSGKSNVMDAVRFVLGELSARSLRADKFAEVIFDGAQGEKTKSAWVAVQFDNSDKQIPVDADIISISREVDRSGQSTYRLNGRRTPRSQLVDILTVAGLQAAGYNMIMQGTVTRLADVTPEERRKIIEDLIGIAEYDAKKAEAQVQLNQAEINLKVATAHIEEVQKRIEDLERERNDALRYNFIHGEIKRLQAKRVSYKISEIQREIDDLSKKLEKKKTEADTVKRERDELQSKRDQIESEWRKFNEEVVDKGNVRLFTIQKNIGDINAEVASLKTGIDAEKISLVGLDRLRGERLQLLNSIRKAIESSRKNLERLKRQRDRIQKELDEKQSRYTEVSKRVTEMRANLGQNTLRIEKMEGELEALNRNVIRINAKLEGSTAKSKVLLENLQILEDRRAGFETTFQNIQAHLRELRKFQKEAQGALEKVYESITRGAERKGVLEQELTAAERTAQRAKKAIVEFETQKDFAEKVAAEERALKEIEEMGRVGAIHGIYGRLGSLIKMKPESEEAIEAASVGWLQSIVVANLETALKCVESLKRTKLGRIKLIPLKEISSTKTRKIPSISGVIDTAVSLIKCDSMFKPAVNFIFGDTVVVRDAESALEAIKRGYRVVTVDGDLYELGGGMESGYYRAPIDLAAIIPSESAIQSLSESVGTLETLLERRRTDIRVIDEETDKMSEEKVRREEVIRMLDSETNNVQNNIKHIRQNISAINRRIRSLRRLVESEKTQSAILETRKNELQRTTSSLQSEARALKLKVKPSVVARYESEKTTLSTEIGELQRALVKITSGISFMESNLENTLKPEFERYRIEISTFDKQIRNSRKKVGSATTALEEATKKLYELDKLKEQLSVSFTTVKDERKKFETALDSVDAALKKINSKYEPATSELHQIELAIQTCNIDLKHAEEELYSLGCEQPFKITPEELRSIESALDLMILELEKLGSVNQLAIQQYDQYEDNYRQLSVRRNQLEEERRAIINFMEEIERKKRSAFTKAYETVNENFKTFFSKLTNGGEGWLQLQIPEDPFAGGLDIFVKFPGKTARFVSGASGGEKSVAAVSFIFAVQELSPAVFYVFDEIDAHLDPSNAERLADLLREQATNSQFIVISLRDVVIDRAERLFGVYVQNGISHVVSTKLPHEVA